MGPSKIVIAPFNRLFLFDFCYSVCTYACVVYSLYRELGACFLFVLYLDAAKCVQGIGVSAGRMGSGYGGGKEGWFRVEFVGKTCRCRRS